MENNVGLDFGTTYSVVSRITDVEKDENGDFKSFNLDAWQPSESASSPCQDSIVLKKVDNTLSYGLLARNETGRKGSTLYRGFKMMLAESDYEELRKRGYDNEEYSPRNITKLYLEDILKRYLKGTNDGAEKIDKLVVGVPEIWFSDPATIDSRTTLETVLEEFDFVDNVELVSEPAAACVYFAENYWKSCKKKYDGKILLVDYGGGTLDITLCDVTPHGNRNEVMPLKRCGAGINEEGKIGQAGLAYIEEVVKLALSPLGIDDSELLSNRWYYRCLNDTELALMSKISDIQDVFELNMLNDKSTISDSFYTLEFGEEEVDITYGMLFSAYKNVISKVLDEKLNEVIDYMDSKGINYKSSENDDFKIAMVGGFCNFFLTREQIKERFKYSTGDRRFDGIIDDKRSCELAISYGAALIANEIGEVKQPSPYYLGIAGGKKERPEIVYIINKDDEIEYNKPVFCKDSNGVEMLFMGVRIPLFVLNLNDNPMDNPMIGESPEEFRRELALDPQKYYKIGFSLDRSMIITLHLQSVDIKTEKVIGKSQRKLSTVHHIFGDLIRVRR